MQNFPLETVEIIFTVSFETKKYNFREFGEISYISVDSTGENIVLRIPFNRVSLQTEKILNNTIFPPYFPAFPRLLQVFTK